MGKEPIDVEYLRNFVLNVECPNCKSEVGERCRRGKSGEYYSPALSHMVRFRLVADAPGHRPGLDAEGSLPTVEEFNEPNVERAREVFYAEQKEERIKQVLFGISFARNIMNMSQKEIDLRLAIMLVEAEQDFALMEQMQSE